MDILTAYADAKGWVTAKAGRPDVHRAGNASKSVISPAFLFRNRDIYKNTTVLRALAEGRIGWCFWPPGTPLDQIGAGGGGEQGIWVPRGDTIEDDDMELESDLEEAAEDPARTSEEEEDMEDSLSSDVATTGTAGIGRYGALAINDTEEDGDEDDTDDSN